MTATPRPVVLTISPGPRNARTDAATGLRFYTWQGRELPSVTTLRRMAGVPHRLHQWAITQVVTRAVERFEELVGLLTRERRPRERVLEKNRRREAARWLRLAATEERDARAKLGTEVHDAAAQGRSLEDVADEVRPRLRQFRHWLTYSGAEIVASEFQVWNLTRGYAGTADLLVRFRDGSLWLIDLKTGNGTYSEHALQVLAYVCAEFVGFDDRVDEELTALLRRVTGMAVLHLADDHWEFKSVKATARMWAAFLGLLEFATWMHAFGSIEDVSVGVRGAAA